MHDKKKLFLTSSSDQFGGRFLFYFFFPFVSDSTRPRADDNNYSLRERKPTSAAIAVAQGESVANNI
jgi:hypothetical protein